MIIFECTVPLSSSSGKSFKQHRRFQWLLLRARSFFNVVDDVLTEFYQSPLGNARRPGAWRSARFRVTRRVIEINHRGMLGASATDIFINLHPLGTSTPMKSNVLPTLWASLPFKSSYPPEGWNWQASGGFEGQVWEDYSCKAHPRLDERGGA